MNVLAQSGSNIGNFIYIDTSVEGYQARINEALSENLGLALNQSTKPKLTLSLDSKGFKDIKVCEIAVDYEEAKVEEDP